MRIDWDASTRTFRAEFSPGAEWANDQQAAKDAGFKTSGPPAWSWSTPKVEPLNKLKAQRPASGLNISQEALAAYTQMQAVYEANQIVLTQLKEAKKERKRAEKKETHEGLVQLVIPAKGYIDASDLPPWITLAIRTALPPNPNSAKCISCGDALYFYEHPKFCLWCEKIYLTKSQPRETIHS